MPTEEVQGMMEILAKLNEAEKLPPTATQKLKNEKNAPKPTILASVSKNAQGLDDDDDLLDILHHLTTTIHLNSSYHPAASCLYLFLISHPRWGVSRTLNSYDSYRRQCVTLSLSSSLLSLISTTCCRVQRHH